jgi:hypothetical protein
VVDKRSSYALDVALDAHAKFGWASGSASFRIQMSQEYRTSARSLAVILTKAVHTDKQFLRNPLWSDAAIKLFKSKGGPAKFVQRYGDYFVRAVHLGDLFTAVYTLNFSSIEQKDSFFASFDGSYAGSSGGASFNQKIVRDASVQSVSVQGLCSGVKLSPHLFYEALGPDQRSRNVSASDKLADELLQYFDEFEKHVAGDGVPASLYFDLLSVYDCDNAPDHPRIDLSEFNDVLDIAAKYDDAIYSRIAVLDYILAYALAWNPSASPAKIAPLRNKLASQAARLESETKKISNLSVKKPKLPIKEADIPDLPRNWVARHLQAIRGGSYRETAINQVGKKMYERKMSIPDIEPDMPLGIHFKMHCETADFHDGVGVELEVVAYSQSTGRTVVHQDHIYGGAPRDFEDYKYMTPA